MTDTNDDRTIRLWDVGSGRAIRVLSGHEGGVLALVYHPDGKRIASSSRDGTVRIWDLAGGSLLRVLIGHAGAVGAVDWSRDGHRLASGGEDRTVRLWDPETGREQVNLRGHTQAVSGVAFHPDGGLVASCTQEWGSPPQVKLWDATVTRQDARVLPGHAGALSDIAFSPDGTLIATADQGVEEVAGGLYAWDVETGLQLMAQSVGLTGVAFDAKGRVVTSAEDLQLIRWSLDGDQREVLSTPPTNPNTRPTLVVAPGGERAAYFRLDENYKMKRSLIAVDGTGFEVPLLSEIAGGFEFLCFDPTSRRLALAGSIPGIQDGPSNDGHVWIWESEDGKLVSTFRAFEKPIATMALGQGGRLIAATDGLDQLIVRDVESGKILADLKGTGCRGCVLAFAPDGLVLAVGGKDGSISLLESNGGRSRQTLTGSIGPVTALAFSPDGTRLGSSGVDGAVRIWDVARGSLVRSVEVDRSICALAFDLTGRRLAAAGGKNLRYEGHHYLARPGTVRVWERETGRLRSVFRGFPGTVRRVVFSRDGTRLVTLGDDGSVLTWELAGGKLVARLALDNLREHHNGDLGVDGSILVAISLHEDPKRPNVPTQGLVVWDIAKGRKLAQIEPDRASSIFAIRPDGAMIALADNDGKVALWDLATGKVAREFSAHREVVTALVFSPDGRRLVTTQGFGQDDEAELAVWEVATGSLIARRTINPSTGLARPVLSPDGSLLATPPQSLENEVRIWDADLTSLRLSLRHPAAGNGNFWPVVGAASLAFHPDGRRLATAGAGATVKVWDLSSGAQLLQFDGAVGPVAFSPDGRTLVGGSPDGSVLLWDASPVPASKLVEVRARDRVAALSRRYPLRREVSQAVLADPELDDDTRSLAHLLAAQLGDDTPRFLRDIRQAVLNPGSDPSTARDASSRIEAEYDSFRETTYLPLLSTLALARYRAGHLAGALEALEQGFKADAEGQAIMRLKPGPVEYALRSLLKNKLGRVPEAIADLERARVLLPSARSADVASGEALIREASGMMIAR